MSWRLIGRGLRLTYLLRVPLLTLLVLAALGPISLSSNLLGNLLDQGTRGWYLFTISFAAFLLGFTAVTTLNLILHYGSRRFEGAFESELAQRRPLLVFFSGLTAALILTACVYERTIPKRMANIGPLALGALAALGVTFLAKVIQLALTDPKSTPHPPPLLVFPAYLIPPLERLFDRLYCWSSGNSKRVKSAFGRITQFPLQILRPAGQGYLVRLEPPPGEELDLLSGHVFALSLSVMAFVSYLVIGLYKSKITAEPARVPAPCIRPAILHCRLLGLGGLDVLLRPVQVSVDMDADTAGGAYFVYPTVGSFFPRRTNAIRSSRAAHVRRIPQNPFERRSKTADPDCVPGRRNSGRGMDGRGSPRSRVREPEIPRLRGSHQFRFGRIAGIDYLCGEFRWKNQSIQSCRERQAIRHR